MHRERSVASSDSDIPTSSSLCCWLLCATRMSVQTIQSASRANAKVPRTSTCPPASAAHSSVRPLAKPEIVFWTVSWSSAAEPCPAFWTLCSTKYGARRVDDSNRVSPTVRFRTGRLRVSWLRDVEVAREPHRRGVLALHLHPPGHERRRHCCVARRHLDEVVH